MPWIRPYVLNPKDDPPGPLVALHSDLFILILRYFNETNMAPIAKTCSRLYHLVKEQRYKRLMVHDKTFDELIAEDNIYRLLQHYGAQDRPLPHLIDAGAILCFQRSIFDISVMDYTWIYAICRALLMTSPPNGYRPFLRVLRKRMDNRGYFPELFWKSYFVGINSLNVQYRRNASDLFYELDRCYDIPLDLFEKHLEAIIKQVLPETLERVLKKTERNRANRYRLLKPEDREVREMLLRNYLIENNIDLECEPGSKRWERVAKYYG